MSPILPSNKWIIPVSVETAQTQSAPPNYRALWIQPVPTMTVSPSYKNFVKGFPEKTEVSMTESEENLYIATLTPKQRIRYFKKNRPSELLLLFAAAFGGVYLTLRSIVELFPHLNAALGLSAFAQTATIPHMPGSLRDSFDWYVGLLMGLTLLTSQGMVIWSASDSKVAHGKDMVKLIMGFVVGFLSGKNNASSA